MSTRNVTLSLSEDLLRRVRVIAAERDTSISMMVGELLEDLVHQTDDYEDVWARETEVLHQGLPMRVGKVTWSRDEIHDR